MNTLVNPHAHTPYRPCTVGGCLRATVEQRADGVTLLRPVEPLGAYPERLTDPLEHWAAQAPDRSFAARRSEGGQGDSWQHISYAQMLARARAVGQALAGRGLSAERPIAILSENDLEHLTLAMAAMWVGVPYAPVSTAYSLISQDFGKLRHILAKLTPGLVFASSPAYAKAIQAVVGANVEVVLTNGSIEGRRVTPFDELLVTTPGAEGEAAHAGVTGDTIAKFLFTSGSTKLPKGVITTHRMLSANQQMLRQSSVFLSEAPPVLVDWLPWNHTFGGSHNVGIALYNGGTIYIDDGKPTPAGIQLTLRNLREVPSTVHYNVPKGFEEIALAMDHDAQLRQIFFKDLKCMFFAGAGLSQAVWNHLDRHAVAVLGQRVRMLTGLGMTETSPTCTNAMHDGVASGHIGLPNPGCEVKLVPLAGKLEIRFRGPHVMPGYWRESELTREAFDDEGFYCTGDAAKFVDAQDLSLGLLFDGRIAEDFKLATGTFVSVGPLRGKVIAAGAPYVQDVVVTGINRDEIGLLIFPRVDSCRALAALVPTASLAEVLRHPKVRAVFQNLVDQLYASGSGSATRPARLLVMAEPPAIDLGEVTDKGSINQRAVLQHRAGLVEALYAGPPAAPEVLLARASGANAAS
jgi:feruloyl-CoA synthase